MNLFELKKALKTHLASTEQRFISSLIQQELKDVKYRQSPSDSQDIRIFLVLAFGAFEEYLEDLATEVLDEVCEKWEKERVLLRPLANLLAFYRHRHGVTKDSKSRYESNAAIAEGVAACKARHSEVIWNNHGIGMDKLFQLFAPLGIAMTKEPKFVGAANSLSKLRGEAAHKQAGPKQVSAKQVSEFAKDFAEYCEELADTLQKQMHK